MENMPFYTFDGGKKLEKLQYFLFPLPAASGTTIAQLGESVSRAEARTGEGKQSRGSPLESQVLGGKARTWC